MKHIKLYENFNLSNLSESEDSFIFDWIPFDDHVDDPINASVPTEIGLDGVLEYCKSNPEIGKIGLFISHSKLPAGGFIRYITSSTSPVLLDSAVFDSEFKLVNENKGIDPADLDVSAHKKGSSILSRFRLDQDKE